MGGSGPQTTTQSNKIDPEQMKLIMDNYEHAKGVANRPYQPYTGERVADFTLLQLQGMNALTGIANNNVGADTLGLARNAYADLAGYQAPALTSPGNLSSRNISVGDVTAPTVTAGMLKDTDLAPYMNPFTQNVIDTSLADLERQREIQRVKDNQSATAARAFGGSRQGVADSLTNDAYLRNVMSSTANLRSSAYDRAMASAIDDINRRLSVDQWNAANAFDASKTNVANRMAADTYNANNAMSADKYNLDMALGIGQQNAANNLAAAGIRGGAAGSLAGLSSQELEQAVNRAGLLGSVGDMQRQYRQSLNDVAYDNFLREWAYPIQQQEMLNAALGTIPIQQTTTGVQPGQNNTGAILSGVGSIAGAIF